MITIKDVAKEANVSISTVSRVVNNVNTVNEVLRDRVIDAMKKLNYVPSKAAQLLKTGKSFLVGVVVEDITNPFHAEVMKGIFTVLEEYGYNAILCDNDRSISKCISNFKLLQERDVEGIFYSTTKNFHEKVKNMLTDIYEGGTPIVLSHNEGLENICAVKGDDYSVVQTTLNYLYDLGHRKIAFVGGFKTDEFTITKEKAYIDYVKEKNIYNKDYIVHTNYSLEGGKNIAVELLQENKPTAIFAVDDVIAIGILNKAVELNIKVPEELSIIGYNNIEFSEYTNPPLTTISLSKFNLGKTIAQELMFKIKNGYDINKSGNITKINKDLLIRGSTGVVNK